MAAVTDKDLGFRRIITNLAGFDGAQIHVGVLRDAGKEKDGTDLVDVAAYNEYGTKHIPSRPFLRIASDEKGDSWLDLAEEGITAVTAGRMNKHQVLKLVGVQAKADVRKVFGDRSKLEANKASTIRRKGSSAPLIDSGTLRRAVDYRLEE